MRKTFTLSMTFLHTWGGLVFGWLLFMVLLTGSIAVFAGELTYWLTPEIRGGLRPDAVRSMQIGEDYLRAHAPTSRLWRVTLPTSREPALKVTWKELGEGSKKLDPETGAEIVRKTEGGSFFLQVHEDFHSNRDKNPTGFFLVCLAGMAMLVASVSGIVVHKRIFKDLFLFRPKTSPHRAWLDAHNVFGVLALPFHMMMAFTGILLLYWLFLPSAAPVVYPGGNSEFRREANAQDYRQVKGEAGDPAPTAPLKFYVDKAESLFGAGRTAYLYVRDPGRTNAVVEVYRERTERVSQQVDQIAMDRNGTVIRSLLIKEKTPLFRLQSFVASWHWIEWGGNLARWFYFLAGLMGAAVTAAGLVVFTAKRRKGAEGQAWFRIVEAVNVAAVAGACIASVAFFWAERLTPVEAAARDDIPVQAFWVVWAAALVHAALRPARQAWVEQLALTALLCLGAPFLQGLVFRDLATADWVRIAVDATFIAGGLCFALAAWKVRTPSFATTLPARREA